MLSRYLQGLLNAWRMPRWRWALVIAVFSDIVAFGFVLFVPLVWLVDAATAVALFAVLGRRWSLLVALAIELVPGLALFPAWTLVVLALAATQQSATPATIEGPIPMPKLSSKKDQVQ